MTRTLHTFSAGCMVAVAFGLQARPSESARSVATALAVTAANADNVLQYGDGTPDGKKSMAGTGEMIRFTADKDPAGLAGIELYGARYGYSQPPKEDFKVYVLDDDRSKVLHTELVPYAKFERGESKWVTLKFNQPVQAPKTFWVVVDFNAEATKGVCVSYDTSTGGELSMVGLPGKDAHKTAFGGDWMIRTVLAN